MKIKDYKMFKKTLLAAALAAATTTTAFAGTITVSGTAYKVGNEYLAAYTGTALEGDLETAAIGITYQAGIALGVDNTLKFVFAGGAISADTGLKLQTNTVTAVAHPANAVLEGDVGTAVTAVTNATGNTQAELNVELAAAKAAGLAVIVAAEAVDITLNAIAYKAAINAVTITPGVAGDAKLAVAAVVAATLNYSIDNTADLVDFGVDANGDYEWVLFKLTLATTVANTLYFNDTDADASANVVTAFTKATIGSGDLTIAMPEAKDGTGASLAAPVAAAKTLVTTEAQFDVELTAAEDTIDVEQDRIFFASGTGAVTTAAFALVLNEDMTIDLGIDSTTADFVATIGGNVTGVDSVDFLDGTNDGAFDTDNELAGTGLADTTVTVTVDGETNLATRTLTYALEVTPSEADTDAFNLVAASSAFVWDLNGSEITFPYAPIGYSHITTNFELANSGSQDGEILLSAFSRDSDVSYSATLTTVAKKNALTKISETEIYEALGLTEGTSLSITISTTAPAADIKLSGYSNLTTGGRMALLSSAYEGI